MSELERLEKRSKRLRTSAIYSLAGAVIFIASSLSLDIQLLSIGFMVLGATAMGTAIAARINDREVEVWQLKELQWQRKEQSALHGSIGKLSSDLADMQEKAAEQEIMYGPDSLWGSTQALINRLDAELYGPERAAAAEQQRAKAQAEYAAIADKQKAEVAAGQAEWDQFEQEAAAAREQRKATGEFLEPEQVNAKLREREAFAAGYIPVMPNYSAFLNAGVITSEFLRTSPLSTPGGIVLPDQTWSCESLQLTGWRQTESPFVNDKNQRITTWTREIYGKLYHHTKYGSVTDL